MEGNVPRPTELKYTKSHEWLRIDGDVATIGITDYAVEQLGDLTFIDLPETGSTVEGGDALGEVESTKTVSDIYAPLSGEVLAVNEDVAENVQVVADEPFESGWLVQVKLSDATQLDGLLDAESYEIAISEAEH